MPELRPLSEVRVLELSTDIGTRLCGKLLADAGARVTRIEAGLGDATRLDGADVVEHRRFLDRSKAAIGLDLERPGDRGHLEARLGEADLLLTSLTHAEAARWDVDCIGVLARHPELLVACVTPFGQSGPYAGFQANDVVISALSGLADATPGFPDRCASAAEPPVQSRAPLAESGGGLLAAVAVMGALLPRLRGGDGPRHVEVALLEAVVAQMAYEWGMSAYGGGIRGRLTTHADLEPNCYLPCRDGRVALVAFSDRHWRGLLDLMGGPEWASQPEFGDARLRAEHAESLHAHLRDWTMTQSGTAILEGAQARGLPCCCALELADTVASEQVRTAEGVTEEDGILRPADPIVVDGARRPTARPPLAGAAEDQASTRHPAATPSRTQGSEGPLAGVRVLDVSQIVSGPYAGHLLAALGAEVIMVESRSHLVSRGFGPFAGEPAHDASSMFNQVNRGKRSVQLNLATEEGRGILFELAGTADVVLENFSRRAADRLGLTHAALRAVREDIILASISGFGRSGPWGDYVALHSGVILLSGLASVTRDVQGAMRLCGAIYPDLLTGSCAALAIQQAIAARERSGRGCHLELSMLDVMLTCMGGLVGTLGDEPAPPARFLPTTEPTGFLAVPAADASAAEVAGGTRRDAMARLQAGGVPAAAVLTISEVMQDPHLIARDFVGLDDHPVVGPRPIPAVAWQYDGRRSALRHAPLLGEGTEEIIEGLGDRGRDEIAALRERQILW